jgi:hypothetical protein
MEKMSRFISIVPTIPNSTIIPENHSKNRPIRYRRFRGRRRINHRINKPSIQNNESTTVEEISDEVRSSFFCLNLFPKI